MFVMNAQKQREREEKERDERERERIKADVKRGKQAEAPKPDGLAGLSSIRIDDMNLADASLSRRPPERSENARREPVGVSEGKSMPEKKEGLRIEKRASESVERENDVKPQKEIERPAVLNSEVRHEESFSDRLLNYAKTIPFRMFAPNGKIWVTTEPMTFYDRMCRLTKKTLDDAQILDFAKREFRPAVYNGRLDRYQPAERLVDKINNVVIKDPNITLETHFKKVEAEKGRNVGQENLRAFESYEKRKSVGNEDVSKDFGPEV